ATPADRPGPPGEPARPTPTPSPPPRFTIVDRPGSFDTLASVIGAAADGDVIEIHHDGPHPCPKLEVVGRRLTIRAARGCHPVIRPQTQKSPPQWLATDSDLRLEGLELQWPVEWDKADIGLDRPVVMSTGGQLELTNCIVVTGRRGTCVGTFSDGATFARCTFVAPGGAGVGWRPMPRVLRGANCQFEVNIALVAAHEPPSRVEAGSEVTN